MAINRRQFTLATAATLGAAGLSPLGHAQPTTNRRILLNSRPVGKPSVDNFRQDQAAIPSPDDGEILLRTRYLSLDPYMRGRMNAGKSYADRVELGEVMVGGTVSEVVASNNPDYTRGDLVRAFSGWQEYDVSDGQGLMKIDPRIERPSYALGVLGMPGLTAYVGLLDIGEPKPG